MNLLPGFRGPEAGSRRTKCGMAPGGGLSGGAVKPIIRRARDMVVESCEWAKTLYKSNVQEQSHNNQNDGTKNLQPYMRLSTFKRFFAYSAIAFMAEAKPLEIRESTSLPLPSKTVYQFPTAGYWAENIAVRRNGNLLVTLLSPSPQLWQIASPYSDAPSAELVYTFPNMSGLVGIAETAADTFVLAGQNFSTAGVAAAWEVAFADDGNVTTHKVADIPNALVLNGATAVPGCGGSSPSAVLIADSAGGLVFRVDTKTGAVETAVQVSEMAPIANASSPVGINGIKIRDEYLYFDNSYAAALYRIKITSSGFAAAGASVETVARVPGETFLDDFTFGADGSIWIASNHGSTVLKVNVQTGDSLVVAGASNQTTVLGDTAAAFGGTEKDSGILYVTTSGFNVKTPVEAGKIVAIDTTSFR
ncbi:hypothetical protein SCUP515_07838 [Seiridium cupressi]